MTAFFRVAFVAVLSLALLTVGLGAPVLGDSAAVVPDTVATRLDGLPAMRRGGALSRAVTTPMPFSMVGFQVPPGTDLQFRTSVDGIHWEPWRHAELNADEGPDPGAPEARAARSRMSEPLWVGQATRLQTRVRGAGLAARPENVDVDLIDSSGLGRSLGRRVLDRLTAAWGGTPPVAAATPERPAIVSRAQWGADERLRKGSPGYASRVVAGIVHHTAGSNRYSRAEAPAVIRGIYHYHTQSRGWSDVGYNLLIDRYGTVYEGRAGGVTRAVIGAHAGGFNTGTFGVSLVGSFDSASAPAAMLGALDRVLAWKYDIHHVDVLGTTDYTSYGSTRYPAGRTVTLNRLSGHRDVSATTCPGANLYASLGDLRRRVAAVQGPVLLDQRATPTRAQIVNGASISGPITFTTRLRPAGTWQLRVRDAAGNVVHSSDAGGVKATSATVRWTPTAAPAGAYEYTFTSKGRRRARGTVQLVQPTISGSALPTTMAFDGTGTLRTPITVTGRLYPNASWRVVVRDPAGTAVLSQRGRSQTASVSWTRGATTPGRYRWTLSADDVAPVGGTVRLFADRVGRLGARAETAPAAAAVSRRTFKRPANRVVLTRDDLPQVALAAAPLAGRQGPVLYTGRAALPAATATEIDRVLPAGGTIFILGDESVIDPAVEAGLDGRGWVVRRVRGANAIQIAARTANEVLPAGTDKHALVVGAAWRQGIAASVYGARAGAPVLLTRRDVLPAATRRALRAAASVTVVGNRSAVSDAVRQELGATRIGGADAAATAAAVSRRLHRRITGRGTDKFLFAPSDRADGWARAIAAAPRGARTAAPLLLVERTRVPAPTADHLGVLGYHPAAMGRGHVLGGTDHVTTSTRDALSRHLQ